MTKIYLIRHGKTAFNEAVQKKLYGLSFNVNDILDISLSNDGIKEIESKYNELRGGKIDVVFSSTLKRSIQTANILSDIIDCHKIITDKRLNEINYGSFEGKIFDENDYLNGKMRTMKNPLDIRFPNGESFNDVYNRINSFISDIKIKHKEKNILIITHKTVIKMFLFYFKYDSEKNIILDKYKNELIFKFTL